MDKIEIITIIYEVYIWMTYSIHVYYKIPIGTLHTPIHKFLNNARSSLASVDLGPSTYSHLVAGCTTPALPSNNATNS